MNDDELVSEWSDDADVRAAVDDAAAADAELENLESLVIAGDESVSGDDIDAAEKRGRLARLRARGAAKRAADRAEKDRRARVDELVSTVRTMFGKHDGDLVDAFDAAVAALTPFVDTVLAHNADLRDLVGELDAVKPLPDGVDVRRTATSSEVWLSKLDVRVTPLDPVVLGTEALWRALMAAGATREAGSLARPAGIAHDRALSAHLGIDDSDLSKTATPTGPSDVLRRTARLVAERDAR